MKSSYKTVYKDKNILIIGGSFGIGEALCQELASCGANLCITGRSQDKINLLASNLKGNNFAIKCDITLLDDLQNLKTQIFSKWNEIHQVIFCAGIYEPMNLNNFNLTKIEEIIDLNLKGFIKFQAIFIEDFKLQKIKNLAVISSIAGYFGMPNSLGYGCSKAALSNFVESLYYELKPYNVKVQLINPGFVKTRLTDKNNFNMPNIISVKDAAILIAKKMQTNIFEIKFPAFFATVMRFMSLLPYKVRFLLLKFLTK